MLRLQEASDGPRCALAKEAYACSEGRLVALRPKDTPEEREKKRLILAACRGQDRR